jgi:hypothetical protein
MAAVGDLVIAASVLTMMLIAGCGEGRPEVDAGAPPITRPHVLDGAERPGSIDPDSARSEAAADLEEVLSDVDTQARELAESRKLPDARSPNAEREAAIKLLDEELAARLADLDAQKVALRAEYEARKAALE